MDLKLKQQMALLIVSDMFNPVAHTETLRRVFLSERKSDEVGGDKIEFLDQNPNDSLVMLSS